MLAMLDRLVALFAGFFLPSTTPKTSPDPIAGIEQDGALIPPGPLLAALSALQNNSAPSFGNWSFTLIPAISSATYNGASMVGGIIQRFNPGAAFTDCTDTATNIVAAIPGAKVNQTFPMLVANLGSALETLAAGTGVTISGTTTIAANSVRLFLGKVTGSTAVTLTSLFQFGGPAAATPF